MSLENVFPHKNNKYKIKVDVQEVNYYNDGVLLPDKEYLTHPLQYPMCNHRFKKIFHFKTYEAWT